MSKLNGVGCNRQLNSGSLHQQTRRNPRGGDVRSPVEDHDLCHHYQITLKARHILRLSECDGQPSVQVKSSSINRLVTASAGVQQICLVVHPSCRFLCHLSEPQTSPVCVSSPRPNAWDIDALNITGWVALLMFTLLRLSFTR